MKKNRAYYQKLFQDYPDLVTQAQLRQMLNGISISFSSRLIHEKRVQSFFIDLIDAKPFISPHKCL